MIKKLSNNRGVQESSTLTGIRELLREYRNKTNELIDYLQAKEEVDKTWLKEIILKDKGIGEPNYEEASKCICEVVPGLGIKTNYSCPEHGYPSHSEASKGECRQHSCEYYKCRCILDPNTGYCISKSWHVCNHYNPPEHEERLNGFNELLDSLGYIPVQPNQTMKEHEEKNREILQDYIQANFVSKEKIKNLATQMGMRSSAKIVQLKTLNRLQIEDIIYDKILESLGLGD